MHKTITALRRRYYITHMLLHKSSSNRSNSRLNNSILPSYDMSVFIRTIKTHPREYVTI